MKLNKNFKVLIMFILIVSCILSTIASIYFSNVFSLNKNNLLKQSINITKPIIDNSKYLNKLLTNDNKLNINSFKTIFLKELKKQNKELFLLDDLITFSYDNTSVSVEYQNYKWSYKIVYN
ncbi:lipoprotein [Mycoplasma mycoides subsp. capri]|uniref:lipoprotein n=1 Tax=Mycoplasma mycoides TaxID=2102 RepID=UPI002240108E|nr:lipoprotein [Mycoplasma mycoides]UZK64539.1 lipoprotein [Mycoplasma mycoides subsp. capri]